MENETNTVIAHRRVDPTANPFSDPDRRAIWDMCVKRDVEAFLAQDWNICAADFYEPGFLGLDAGFSTSPDDWQLTFPTLGAYRDAWVDQARDFAEREFVDDRRVALYAAVSIARVDFHDDTALVHKKFAGELTETNGSSVGLHWQSLFFTRKIDDRWKVSGFVGYLPYGLTSDDVNR